MRNTRKLAKARLMRKASEYSWNEMKHLFYFETTFLLLRARLSELFDVLILRFIDG